MHLNKGDGKSDRALEDLRLRLKPNRDRVSYVGGANLFLPPGQLDQALADYDRAIELNDTFADGRLLTLIYYSRPLPRARLVTAREPMLI